MIFEIKKVIIDYISKDSKYCYYKDIYIGSIRGNKYDDIHKLCLATNYRDRLREKVIYIKL